MRDRAGRTYREAKSFVIASKPPVLRLRRSFERAPGRHVQRPPRPPRTIVARLYGASPVDLRWDSRAGMSTGLLTIPEGLPAGRYVIRVTAEDFAHNVASQELSFDVIP